VERHETFFGVFNNVFSDRPEVTVRRFTGPVIMRIAILQSDPQHRFVVCGIIERLNHVCIPFSDGLSMSKSLSRSTVDMLILDWHSSGLSGLDLLKSMRSGIGERVPVMFASADGGESNVVRALTAGADDYVTHPVRSAEFGARVEALLRRAYPANTAAITELGPYRFDSRQQSVTVRGQPVQLSGTQFRLALLFFSNIGRVLSRDHIFAMVWGREFRESTRTIDSHVSRLRLALMIEPVNHFRLQPVYKSGYRLLHLYGDTVDETRMCEEESTA
jgi:two-component system, OmpR family, phosphate regulon response regulator PhoB